MAEERMLDSTDVAHVARRPAGPTESARASRAWWEQSADEYQADNGPFLGDARFVWGPEGVEEQQLRLLGSAEELRGARVLELGCGAGQCARWLRDQGAHSVGIDVAHRQLLHSRDLDRRAGTPVPVAQADTQALPFADAAFDIVCSAFGAFPFVPDAAAALVETARVLRPGGTVVFSVSHPVRWCFPDDPGPGGLVASDSYFDRSAYVEEDSSGRAVYVEHHHTLGDWVRAVAAAGLRMRDLVEPEWPEDNDRTWEGWSPLRGHILPGTAIVVAVKDAA